MLVLASIDAAVNAGQAVGAELHAGMILFATICYGLANVCARLIAGFILRLPTSRQARPVAP